MFYTIEGIDGAGCGVVRRALEKKLTEEGIVFESLKYPVPNLVFGRDIYDFMDGKIEMTSEAQFLAFAGQMVAEKQRLTNLRQNTLIVDRYLPCTLVFQGAKGFPLQKGLEFAKLFDMVLPDRIFYLKVPWEVAYERKNKEARESDIHEKDKNLYQKTADLYDKMLEKEILAPWTVIDATQTPEEEAKQIVEIIKKESNK